MEDTGNVNELIKQMSKSTMTEERPRPKQEKRMAPEGDSQRQDFTHKRIRRKKLTLAERELLPLHLSCYGNDSVKPCPMSREVESILAVPQYGMKRVPYSQEESRFFDAKSFLHRPVDAVKAISPIDESSDDRCFLSYIQSMESMSRFKEDDPVRKLYIRQNWDKNLVDRASIMRPMTAYRGVNAFCKDDFSMPGLFPHQEEGSPQDSFLFLEDKPKVSRCVMFESAFSKWIHPKQLEFDCPHLLPFLYQRLVVLEGRLLGIKHRKKGDNGQGDEDGSEEHTKQEMQMITRLIKSKEDEALTSLTREISEVRGVSDGSSPSIPDSVEGDHLSFKCQKLEPLSL